MYDEAYRLRRDAEDDADDRSREPQPEDPGAPRVVGITATDGHYPAAPNVFYKVELATVAGDEAEGSPATVTGTGVYVYAYNHGDTVPGLGTRVELTGVAWRWVFGYYG